MITSDAGDETNIGRPLRPPGIFVVGLTGGIATGKSLVAEELRRLGAPVLDADIAAREVVRPGSPGLKRVIDEFGGEFLLPDGSLDRSRLGRLVFADPDARARLEAIIHPLVREYMYTELEDLATQGVRVAVVDVPLLVETGLYRQVDQVWVVTTSVETQKQRLVQRDGLTETEAERRIGVQLPLSAKCAVADVIINNDGSRAATRQQVAAAWSRLVGGENKDL